jgi:hypothetical protein
VRCGTFYLGLVHLNLHRCSTFIENAHSLTRSTFGSSGLVVLSNASSHTVALIEGVIDSLRLDHLTVSGLLRGRLAILNLRVLHLLTLFISRNVLLLAVLRELVVAHRCAAGLLIGHLLCFHLVDDIIIRSV